MEHNEGTTQTKPDELLEQENLVLIPNNSTQTRLDANIQTDIICQGYQIFLQQNTDDYDFSEETSTENIEDDSLLQLNEAKSGEIGIQTETWIKTVEIGTQTEDLNTVDVVVNQEDFENEVENIKDIEIKNEENRKDTEDGEILSENTHAVAASKDNNDSIGENDSKEAVSNEISDEQVHENLEQSGRDSPDETKDENAVEVVSNEEKDNKVDVEIFDGQASETMTRRDDIVDENANKIVSDPNEEDANLNKQQQTSDNLTQDKDLPDGVKYEHAEKVATIMDKIKVEIEYEVKKTIKTSKNIKENLARPLLEKIGNILKNIDQVTQNSIKEKLLYSLKDFFVDKDCSNYAVKRRLMNMYDDEIAYPNYFKSTRWQLHKKHVENLNKCLVVTGVKLDKKHRFNNDLPSSSYSLNLQELRSLVPPLKRKVIKAKQENGPPFIETGWMGNNTPCKFTTAYQDQYPSETSKPIGTVKAPAVLRTGHGYEEIHSNNVLSTTEDHYRHPEAVEACIREELDKKK